MDDSVFFFLFFPFVLFYLFLGKADYGEKEHWGTLL